MTPGQDYMFSPALLCLCTNLRLYKSRFRLFPDSSALRSALNSWKSGNSSARSGMFSLSHVSVKQRIAYLRMSMFLPVRRSSSSILLLRERTFARWIKGSGVQSPLLRSFTSAPARFPLQRFRRSIP
ncbi:hypothetical protein AMECASPLE_025637 [Ameca splendens]|uniref:Uncharacterized protein n=1 Tax=Ameca splendens TaxID=208324 RepID=A0ABV0XHT7_9TELE